MLLPMIPMLIVAVCSGASVCGLFVVSLDDMQTVCTAVCHS